MPDRVLIANRGEIAVRVARTLARLGVESVAVFSPEDAGGVHPRACDRAVALRPGGASSPYLDVDQLVGVARETGCDAVHPGYGFLAERADAARAFEDAGVAWIGPGPDAIDLLGDKIRSKETAAEAGVPVVPGLQGEDVDEAAVRAFADDAGLPILLKASAGGGGKGMRRVDDAAAIPGAVDAARREAQAAFGRGELLVERLVDPARHVEVQVAADAHGTVVAIGERECSLQRRHQKLLEESPAVCLSDEERAAFHEAAVRLATAAGYRNLGTVEFLLDVSGARPADGPRPFYFLEMNARLQVEHPVTEFVHGLDLVELQLRIADGERIDAATLAGPAVGHAIEARITAERIAGGTGEGDAFSPARFLPAVGPVVAYREPSGPGVRVDSGIEEGTVVTTAFDPMLMKVIATGRDRAQALQRLDRALADLVVLGVETNAGFLRRLIARDEVVEDRPTTTLVEQLLAEPAAGGDLSAPPAAERDRALRALVAARHARLAETAGPGAFAAVDSWRSGAAGWTPLDLLDPDDAASAVRARATRDGVVVLLEGEEPTVPAGDGPAPAAGTDAPATVPAGDGPAPAAGTDAPAGTAVAPTSIAAGTGADPAAPIAPDPGATLAQDGPWWWLHVAGGTWAWRDRPEATGGPGGTAGGLEAPLPGVVLAVRAQVGDRVAAGETVLVVESMKMELDVTAPHDGTVASIDVAVGDSVARGQVLAAVEEDEA